MLESLTTTLMSSEEETVDVPCRLAFKNKLLIVYVVQLQLQKLVHLTPGDSQYDQAKEHIKKKSIFQKLRGSRPLTRDVNSADRIVENGHGSGILKTPG